LRNPSVLVVCRLVSRTCSQDCAEEVQKIVPAILLILFPEVILSYIGKHPIRSLLHLADLVVSILISIPIYLVLNGVIDLFIENRQEALTEVAGALALFEVVPIAFIIMTFLYFLGILTRSLIYQSSRKIAYLWVIVSAFSTFSVLVVLAPLAVRT